MITLDRLLELLDKWKLYMHTPEDNLGYPKRSVGMSSGGESSYDAFDEMYESVEHENVKVVNAAIGSLDHEEIKAIYARYLNTKKPMYYELKLQSALEHLLPIVSKRINV